MKDERLHPRDGSGLPGFPRHIPRCRPKGHHFGAVGTIQDTAGRQADPDEAAQGHLCAVGGGPADRANWKHRFLGLGRVDDPDAWTSCLYESHGVDEPVLVPRIIRQRPRAAGGQRGPDMPAAFFSLSEYRLQQGVVFITAIGDILGNLRRAT